ncbi:ImmA/IrrE family metallo-endopeptidase [Sinimarinibacterium flocculans]|uniref:ImmA/IrrE family metallo-endopeptidase n=1 Tax=Sinimarinibacterium flocculans TaxID=985250 RepID=UPI003519BD96
MTRVAVRPAMVQWARERAGLELGALAHRFAKLAEWESGAAQPTFRQLEDFAKATHVPFGYLFLPEPPAEPLPIPDFRTLRNQPRSGISPDLRDTIHAMRRRQDWLREERSDSGVPPVEFVGSARLIDDAEAVGREMRRTLGLDRDWAASARGWDEAVGRLRAAIEVLGVMAVINGIVGNNTHRVLDVAEFRGFALSDPLAPLIFVNGADAKSAQMFTLAHELAHLWLGEIGEGLSGFPGIFPDGGQVESFCDRAAAECLVPAAELQAIWPEVKREASPFELLARHFKVSPIVIGRRAMDLRLVERQAFFDFYEAYIQRERRQRPATPGGDFYRNQSARVGKLFATEVVRAAKEGRIGFKQAYELTGLNGGAFQEYAGGLGMDLP